MDTLVRIPPQLRPLTENADEVKASGETVRAVFATLTERYPGLKERLFDERGVRRHVNVFVGDEDIRFLEGLDTALKPGDQISIIPAIAGGS
ncbi:MAG: MoaD/ThiS family protein [Polyangiaceae bacterium]